jgi:hypothetical protein
VPVLGFLSEVVAFPTVIFTGVLALACLYWGIALFGLVDLGALDGAVEATEGITGVADIGGGRAAVAEGPRLLGLGEVPMTISLTLLAFFGWIGSFFGMRLASKLSLPEWLKQAPDSTTGWVVLVLAGAGGVAVTSLAIRPLRPLFRLESAPVRASFLGSSCTVVSSRVDESFGYADVAEGGAGLRVDVRCRPPNPLRSGSVARLESWDAEREVYWVRPVEGPESAEAGRAAGASGSERR